MKAKKILAVILTATMLMGATTFSVTAESTTSTETGTATVEKVPTGTITPGYTRQDAVWGEATSNSEESFYVELYAGEDKIATSTLNNIGGIIDGDVFVTWSVPFAGSTDEYWTVEWEAAQPRAGVVPTKVVLYSDGVKVAENTVKMSAPDDLNPVVWAELEALNLSGAGTAEDPYLISNLEELKMFKYNVNDGNAYKGKVVKLAADIDLDNEEWTPIGGQTTYTKPNGSEATYNFEGYFDGGNHTIRNLKITMPGKSNVGLFGYTTGGEVKNLTVENASVSGRLNVGVVAGTPYTSKYTNISVTGHVEVNGMAYVGGVGGKNAYANWTDITVDVDDTSYVKANSVENGTAYRTYAGGVVGFMGEGGHEVFNVTSNIDVYGSTCDVGGIAGIAHYGNSFINCSSSGDVYLEDANENEIGGITGVWNNGGSAVTFENCSFTGSTYIAGEKVNVAVSGPAYSTTGTGTREIVGKVTLNGVEKETLAQALSEAKEMTEPAVIDLLGNNATINKAYYLNNDITFKNGMLIFDDYDGFDPAVYDPAGIYRAVMTIGANVTFDNVILTGENAVAETGLFVLGGVMSLTNGSELNVSAPRATAVIYSEGTGKLIVNNSKINIDGEGNAVRGMLAVEIDADDAEIIIKNITDNAMRNIKGSIDNSTLTVDGAELGIKNEGFDGVITVTNSQITVTNIVNDDHHNAGICLVNRARLVDTNSNINSRIYIHNGDGEDDDTVLDTLNFDTNGGIAMTSLIDEGIDEIDLSDYKPTRDGYSFGGWYADEELTEPVATILLDEPTTVYAKWVQNTVGGGTRIVRYMLTFDTDGGSEVKAISIVKNTTADLSEYITEKEGYTFEGWYTDKELTNKVTSIKMTAHTTLYAKWTENTEDKGDNKPALFTDEHIAYIVGREENLICPEDNITRAEVATIFFRLLTEEARSENLTDKNSFSDVSSEKWFNTAVSTLANMGILKGRTEETFAPDEYITRAEFTAIAARFSDAVYEGGDIFSDTDGHWAKEYINTAADLGWVIGENGLFRPDDNITRAEVMTLVNRILGRMPERTDDLLDGMTTWADNADTNVWYYLAVQEATNSHECEMKADGVHEKWTKLTQNSDQSK